MKFVTATLVFISSVALAQDIYVPPTGYQPPTKADDILPIAPMRLDEHAEFPDQVFTSVDKNDPWEKYERGEGKNSKSTVLIADKNKKGSKKQAKSKGSKNQKQAKNAKGKTKKIAKKGKVDSKKNVAKLKKSSKSKTAKATKNVKRQPASKKAKSKKKK